MTKSEADPLLQPYRLRHLTLRNRIVSTSHEPAYTEAGMPGAAYRAYHVEKARGGVGLSMIGGSAVVSPDSPPSFGNIELYRDEAVPHLRRLVDEVHDHGTAVMCQLTHLGRRTSNYAGDWLPTVAPSPLREASHRSFPKEAEEWDIDRIVDDFVSAALRCQEAGLDGIELEHYGHFLDAWVSPATNHRVDHYGGSLEHRMAVPLRVLAAVRRAVGPDFLVGIRMAVDEDLDDGLHLDEGIAALAAYAEAPGIGLDFVSVIKGHIDSDLALTRAIPMMGTRSAPFLEVCAEVKRRVDLPVMHAARIADVATARYAVSEGLLDLVGMTRAQMADPHLVAKVAAGQEDRIRPCVGASFCLDAIYESGRALCVHNPATGRELELPHELVPTQRKRLSAVVVGLGPAGLEATRVLAARGHDVTAFEANDMPGGQLRLAASLKRRRDLLGIVDWRIAEATRSGAELRLGTYAEAHDVQRLDPDLVVIATGGLPNRDFLTDGSDQVVDTWDLLDRSARPRPSVLVYDDNGQHPGLAAVEFLAEAGSEIHYVTPERVVGPQVGGMNIQPYLETFAVAQVRVTLVRRLVRVVPRADGRLDAVLSSEHTGAETVHTVDQVVVEHGTLPLDELYRELAPASSNLGEVDHRALLAGRPQNIIRNPSGRYQLFRIGDAVTSRNIHAAVLDALRLCSPY